MATDIGLLQARAMALPGKTRAECHAVYRKSLKTRAQLGDLLCYIEYVHGGKHADIRSFVRSPHARVMADHLAKGPRTLMVSHPESGKSLLHRSEMEMWLGIQTELAFNAGGTVPSALYVMGTLDKQAKPQVLDVRGTLEFNRHYKELFPTVAPDKAMGWEKDLFFLKRPDEKRRPEPTLMATGCEGDVQGMRFGKILVDDPISQKDAKSPTIVHDRVVWILATLERRVIEGGEIRYVFTRWHEKDAFPQLSRITPTLVMPVYGFWEAHPEYGVTADTLWPTKWPRARVEVERNKLIDTGEAGLWHLVWMCSPQQAEGGIVKRSWLRWAPSPLEREPIEKEEESVEVVV